MSAPTTVTLTGSWPDETGYVSVIWPTLIKDSNTYAGKVTRTELDSNGDVSIPVYATDDAGINPSNTYYIINMRIGEIRQTFAIAAPHATPTIDLNDAIPIDPLTPGWNVYVPGGGGGGSGDDGGLSLEGFITPGVGVNCTTGIRNCIAAAVSGGYTHVKPVFSLFPMEIDDPIEFGSMEFRGFSDEGPISTFKCTTSDARLMFGDVDNGYQGSWSGNFRIDANNLATSPLIVGVKVQWKLFSVSVVNVATTGSLDGGAGLWLKGTQNSVFEEILVQGGNAAVRLDGGCATNKFLRCEWNLAKFCLVDFCSITSIVGLFNNPGWNTFDTNIFEYNPDSMTRLVYHRSGNFNLLTDCVVYVTTADTSSVTVAVEAVDFYGHGAGGSSLRLRGCTIGCTPVSNTKIASKATYPAQILVEDGNTVVGFKYAHQGFQTLSGQQTYFEIGTSILDETTGFPNTPVENKIWSTNHKRPGPDSIVWASFVDGEDYPRAYMSARGAFALGGDGTANPNCFFYVDVDGTLHFIGGAGTNTTVAPA